VDEETEKEDYVEKEVLDAPAVQHKASHKQKNPAACNNCM
jgi:hypothetical protein